MDDIVFRHPLVTTFDRMALAVAPHWALSRIRARLVAETLGRHFDAATAGRRTNNWQRSAADANAVNLVAAPVLRAHARDLVRNNAWAKNALRAITRNTVGWGLVPKAVGGDERAGALWKTWGETPECDADGRLSFYGIQALVMRTVAESGEALVRLRFRQPRDELSIPCQLQVLEPDFLDATQDGFMGQQGGPVIQGIEFDAIGRRVAYWLFEMHPGAARQGQSLKSKRVLAENVLHVYSVDRPGQTRGVSWFSAAIVNLRDFDEYEDATLMRQKIAARFAAFVTDLEGGDPVVGEGNVDPLIETLEPGMISRLPPGKQISFAQPPSSGEDGFSARTLRRIAAALGVTYEDLTGDYSQVNFSSARMARLSHWANVHDWRWNMLVPQFCDVAWGWAMRTATIAGLLDTAPLAEWTPPPMPMIEPDKEGLAIMRKIRAGLQTPSDAVREQGFDPDAHWAAYAADLATLDRLGIKLDSDVRAVSQAGLTQERAGAGGGGGGNAQSGA